MQSIDKCISIWLLLGCIMVWVQLGIGGVTRLTNSGLSITEWNIIKGTLPPLTDQEWHLKFELYKVHAKKQYESIHNFMSVTQFKQIYFWEYFHRLWARIMGFVFIIPLMYFIAKRKLSNRFLYRIFVIFLLASLSAIFGWIMVASGLNNDKRTWVSAYNLLVHLILVTGLFSYLIYTFFQYTYPNRKDIYKLNYFFLWKIIGILIFIQIAFGALMAGMKAGLIFPYPFIIVQKNLFLTLVNSSEILSWYKFYDYEPNNNIKLLVQVLHRANGFVILLSTVFFILKNKNIISKILSYKMFFLVLSSQIILGIITISQCSGSVPFLLGLAHQLLAFGLVVSYLWSLYITKSNDESNVL